MDGHLFLIHWNKDEADALASGLRAQGWQVEVEAHDGAQAGRRILAELPDAVVIYLTRLPSHGRETAHWLRSIKATRATPIVFVDGVPDKVEKVKAKVPDAIYTTSAELQGILGELTQSPGTSSQ